jgi:DNA polymerase-1
MYGVKRDDVLLTNVVLCTTKAPPTQAIAACSKRLQHDIGQADTIIAAGAEAAKAVIGAKSLSGTRGYAHDRYVGNRKQRVICTNNPAVVLKEDSQFPNLVRDFKLALNPTAPQKLPEVIWTNDVKTAKQWIPEIVKQRRLFCDIETRGLAHTASIASIGISASGHKALAFGDRVVADEDFFRHYLRPAFEIAECTYIWHNGKFDVRNLRNKGINARVDEDTLLLSYACDERSDEEQVHSLDYLCMNELSWPNYEPQSVKNWKAKVGLLERQGRYDELAQLETPEELFTYNALDAAGTAYLYSILEDRARDDGVLSYYRNCLLRIANSFLEVELRGVHYDINRAADINEREVLPELNRLKEEMRLIVGDGNYNPNSPKQNAELVYDKWNIIHAIDRGEDKERAVDKAVYTEIAAGRFSLGFADNSQQQDEREAGQRGSGHRDSNGQNTTSRSEDRKVRRETAIRWAERFAQFKALDKQRSTYIEALIQRAEAHGGKIYTDFKLHSTVTGRSSSSRPNLQNITRAKEGLPNIRSLFVASPGCKILSADYSQAELRTIAKLSGNTNLGNIYRTGESLHKRVAERFYGENYTYEQYVHAKNMDFGVAYGQSADTFQEKHDIPVNEGRKFIDWWFRTFPEVKQWRQSTAREVLSNGYIQSPFGSKRRFHLITFENKGSVIREAINYRPQNIAAIFTLLAASILVEQGLPVILSVHDSIVLDSPETDLHDHARIVKEVMENAPKEFLNWTDIPYEVELNVGPNWGELEDYG